MMTSKKKTVFGIVLLFLLISGIWLLRLYRQPLGPALELPTSTQPITMLATFPIDEIVVNSTATAIQPTAVLENKKWL